jgi:acetylglutamate kinase
MKPVVIKIGGSTLGSHDTTIDDLVTLHRTGAQIVVVHGGAREVTDWLTRLSIPTKFVNGLRVTNLETLKVVTAVLAGLVNKELVSALWKRGGKAIGLSGADGNLIQGYNKTPALGYTGEKLIVDVTLLKILLKEGYIPVIAPICLRPYGEMNSEINLINVNGDTTAAEIAAAVNAERLIFLTDVKGIYDTSKKLIKKLNCAEASHLVKLGIASGGMVAKIKACLVAVPRVPVARIIDGTAPHSLINEIEGKVEGTTIAG